MTVATDHAFLEAVIDRDYARELFADVGWKVYSKLASLPKLIARTNSRDSQ
jgi:hypothetical protein